MILLKKILKITIICTLLFILFVVGFNRFYIPIQQKYYNNKLLKNKAKYTIMCLGESTTAGQYPIQLQQILDDKYPNKFSIIDCGIPGTTLETILDLLDNNIVQYKPDFVICMMGGSDITNIKYQNNIHTKNKFLIFKKFLRLFSYCYNKIKKQKPIVYDTRELLQNINFFSNKLKTAVNLYYQGKNDEAKIIFQSLLKKNPKDEISYYFLSMINNNLQAYINAINLNFSFMRFEYYGRTILYYKSHNNMEKAKYFAEMACNDKIPSSVNVDLYGVIKNIISEDAKTKIEEQILNKDIDHISYSLLAIKYLELKDSLKAQEYFDKATEIRLNFPNLKTYSLYKLIIKKLIDNNIKVICMQYPVRSILPLQEQLKNESYYDKITFISNEKIFKQALMKQDYNKIFNDQSGGDFGHCTDLGNTLIAENVVNTLEEILDLK